MNERPDLPRADVDSQDGAPVAGALGRSLACAAFVMLAVALEVVAGQAANSTGPGWAYGLVPLTWPPAGRVVWWLVVAAAAAGHRYHLVRARLATGRWLGGLLAAPFVLFAVSIAAGASWSTWH